MARRGGIQNALQIALKAKLAHRSFGHPWSDALRMTSLCSGDLAEVESHIAG
jgi:hypothetical protein